MQDTNETAVDLNKKRDEEEKYEKEKREAGEW